MRKINYSILIAFAFFTLCRPILSFAQPISKGQFKQLFTQGNLMMLDNFYDTACKTFLYLGKTDPSNANVNYKIGVCYLHLPGQKAKAIPYFENAIKQTAGSYREDDPGEKNAPEDAAYYLGQAFHYAYRFDEAIEQFKKFRDLVAKWNIKLVKEIDHWTEMSKNAKELYTHPVECTITNLGDSVNSQFADYSPVIAADESSIAFTSRREGTGGPNNKTVNDDFFEDIWICYQGKYGTWTKAKSISNDINTEGNEATTGISADGQQLYVYRDDKGDGNIYISNLNGNSWDAPFKIDAKNINSKNWEPSACISADGNTLYFVSNREGGFGGRDIYLCRRLANQSWSEPENLGPTINTPYDEDAPFIHPDGTTLFFSSTGHNSMGGFDIFYSTKVANNVWSNPTNIGYPINTTDDDIYFVTSSDGRRAYYASFRPEGKGEKDIYMVSFPKPIVKSVAILVGYLKSKDGSPIPQNSSIISKTKDGHVITCKPNEATGKFIQSLMPGKEYELTIETNNSKIFSDKFFLPEDSSYQNLGRGFFQRTIIIGDTSKLLSMHKVIDTTSKITMMPMDGKILLSQNPSDVASNVTIQILNSQGNIISSAVTDSKGKFEFKNIPSGQNYILKIDENDPVLKTKNQFYLADNNDKIIAPSAQEGKFFLFKKISPDLNKISAMPEKDTLTLMTNMSGKIVNDGMKKISNVKMNLLDENGKILQTKTSDKLGQFTFENIPSDKHYTVSIDENDPALKNNEKLYLANSKDQLIKMVAKTRSYFVFENLPSDLDKMNTINATDNSVLIAMKGKVLSGTNAASNGINNLEVTLFDKKGKVIQKTRTDASGSFRFEHLSADENYSIRLSESDPALSALKNIFLSNETGKIVKEISLDKKSMTFKNLPADLDKMSTIETTDNSTLIAMKGKVLSGTNSSSNGIKNLEVTLIDKKGKVIQKTKTDVFGSFHFEHLSTNESYSMKLNEADPSIASLKNIFLANEAGMVVKKISLDKKNVSFKNLPPDLMQLVELKDSFLPSSKDSVTTILHKNLMYPGDEKFDFVIYFPYNRKEIDLSVGSFMALMNKVAASITEKGSATIMIAASSSSVPTASFKGNEDLANARAEEIKDKVRASMSLKNLDPGKITYEISTKVQGPEYKNDAMQNRKEYEKWQFVKVIVK